MVNIQAFSTVFISILLEAFPFIMIGVIISSIINVFVSEDFIRKVIPENIFIGTTIGALMGFLFPVCDCGVIPVARRLIKKGVPVHTGIAFMLAAPIINPVVLFSTAYAFKNTLPEMIYLRPILGLGIAIAVGIIFGSFVDKKSLLKEKVDSYHEHTCGCGHHHNHEEKNEHHSCCCGHHNEEKNEHHNCGCGHHQHNHKEHGMWDKVIDIIRHSREEFFDVGKYLIIGAVIAAGAQTFVPRDILASIGQNTILSILVMMSFAYLISLCSTSDSFIAKTFIGQFTNSSILGFLLIGPMIDIKNTIVMIGNFKFKYVVKLILLLFALCFAAAFASSYFMFF